MFQAGEQIVYGNLGVCTVVETVQREAPGGAGRQWYYTLEPCFENNMRIYAPVGGAGVRMRRRISREQARRLLDGMPRLRAAARSDAPEALVARCEQALSLEGYTDLI